VPSTEVVPAKGTTLGKSVCLGKRSSSSRGGGGETQVLKTTEAEVQKRASHLFSGLSKSMGESRQSPRRADGSSDKENKKKKKRNISTKKLLFSVRHLY